MLNKAEQAHSASTTRQWPCALLLITSVRRPLKKRTTTQQHTQPTRRSCQRVRAFVHHANVKRCCD